MRNMGENLYKLYNGIGILSLSYSSEDAVYNAIKIPADNIRNSFERFKLIKGSSEDVVIDKLINFGDQAEPFYIAVITGEWTTVVDKIKNVDFGMDHPAPYSYLIMIPKALFFSSDAMECGVELFTAYHDLLEFDTELSVSPNEDVICSGNGPFGYMIPSYDYEITLDMILFAYQNIVNWFTPEADDVLHRILTMNHYDDIIVNDIIFDVIKKCKDSILDCIGTHKVMNIIYQ